MKFSREGKYIVTGGGDKSLIIWDWKEKNPIHRLTQAHVGKFKKLAKYLNKYLKSTTGPIMTLAVSQCDKLILSAGTDYTVSGWSLETGMQEFMIPKAHGGMLINIFFKFGAIIVDYITSVSLSSDDKYIISGSSDGELTVWDIKSRRKLKSFKDVHSLRIIVPKYASLIFQLLLDGSNKILVGAQNEFIMTSNGCSIKIIRFQNLV